MNFSRAEHECHVFIQDLTGGTLVPVEGPENPLFALEVCGINLPLFLFNGCSLFHVLHEIIIILKKKLSIGDFMMILLLKELNKPNFSFATDKS